MKNIIINTAQGDWSQIMHHSNGIDQGEVIVITGEHNDINRDFLLNLWGFSLVKVLYISYDRHKTNLLNSWRRSRLHPYESEIDTIRYIECERSLDILDVKKSINRVRPYIVFIENIQFDGDFKEIIQELKVLAKSMNVAIVINANPEYVDIDSVLNCSLLNKIYYFTNRSAHIYKAKSSEGVKIPIRHNPVHFIVFEDDSADTDEIRKLRKQLSKEKFYDLLTEQAMIQEEEKKEKATKKETSKTLKMTFGQQ